MAPVVQLWGDLFAMESSFAHCVSRDLRMTAGIADEFRVLYGRVDELGEQGRGIGDVAFIQSPKSGFLFYLITKEKYHNRHIDISNVKCCLQRLNQLCLLHGVNEVSIPTISCGLDGLSWNDVLPMICDVFRDSKVRVNILTQPPRFHGMAVLGDSQALRFVKRHGTGFPKECQGTSKSREVGLSKSGQRVAGLLQQLEAVPDNGLFDTLIFIGSNDLLDLCRADSTKVLKNQIRRQFAKLQCILSDKVKPTCRALVLTIPSLSVLLMPSSDQFEASKTSYLHSFLNNGLKKLSNSRFQVIDLDEVLIKDGVIDECLFESSMGWDCREDRIHINARGMEAVKTAIEAVPVFKP